MAAAPSVAAIMIVRDERERVLDALRSLEAVADTWVVLDTGSADGTQALLRDYARERAGWLHEGPFVDFSDARNRLLDLAEPHCDWMVALDADMVWHDATRLRRELETAHEDEHLDGLVVRIDGDEETYWQARALRSGRGWRYRYRVHELAVLPRAPRLAPSTTRALHLSESGSRAGRLDDDLEPIRRDIADRPSDPVPRFYLGGTLRALGRHREAIAAFRRAIALEPDESSELAYVSHLRIAELLERIRAPAAAVEDALMCAAVARPGRWEARALLYERLAASGRDALIPRLEALVRSAPPSSRELMGVDEGARSRAEAVLGGVARRARSGPSGGAFSSGRREVT